MAYMAADQMLAWNFKTLVRRHLTRKAQTRKALARKRGLGIHCAVRSLSCGGSLKRELMTAVGVIRLQKGGQLRGWGPEC